MKKYLYIPSGGHAAGTVTDEWVAAKKAKFPEYAEHAQKVLDLEVGASVTFPSGAHYKRLPDDAEPVSAIICGPRGRAKRCTYPQCTNAVAVLCDFRPERGSEKTCDKGRCRAHSRSVGPDLDYCIEHPTVQRERDDPHWRFYDRLKQSMGDGKK